MQLILYYEERARAVRALAATMRGSEMRQTLMMLAAQWEALAEQCKTLRSGRGVAEPHRPVTDSDVPIAGADQGTREFV